MAKYQLTVTVDGEKVNARTSDEREASSRVLMDPLARRTIGIFEEWLREGKISRSKELQVLGMHLYRSIFNGEVEDLFKTMYKKGRAANERLRVQLSFRAGAGELAGMPWEYLYSPETENQNGFCFSTAIELVLSRYMPPTDGSGEVQPPVEGKLRILVIVSQPENLGPVIAEPVIAQINKLKEQLPIELEVAKQPTLDNLVDQLRETEPHVVHFIGHGQFDRQQGQGQIALIGADDRADWCADDQFAYVFTQVRTKPRLIILHLCESATVELGAFSATFAGLAPKLIQAEVPAVVAMQYPITNQAAIEFSRAFYESLAKGEMIDDAVQNGRGRITTRITNAFNTRVFGTPVLYIRRGAAVILPQANPLAGAAGGKI